MHGSKHVSMARGHLLGEQCGHHLRTGGGICGVDTKLNSEVVKRHVVELEREPASRLHPSESGCAGGVGEPHVIVMWVYRQHTSVGVIAVIIAVLVFGCEQFDANHPLVIGVTI